MLINKDNLKQNITWVQESFQNFQKGPQILSIPHFIYILTTMTFITNSVSILGLHQLLLVLISILFEYLNFSENMLVI